jgi:copper chaperone CopZ
MNHINKHIIFVKDMDCEHCAKRIFEALSETKVDFEVLPNSKAVVIYGRNDLVHIAKVAIREAGFTVE